MFLWSIDVSKWIPDGQSITKNEHTTSIWLRCACWSVRQVVSRKACLVQDGPIRMCDRVFRKPEVSIYTTRTQETKYLMMGTFRRVRPHSRPPRLPSEHAFQTVPTTSVRTLGAEGNVVGTGTILSTSGIGIVSSRDFEQKRKTPRWAMGARNTSAYLTNNKKPTHVTNINCHPGIPGFKASPVTIDIEIRQYPSFNLLYLNG